MTVYVDECQDWPNGRGLWCHMMTDDPAGLSELHRLAAYIGMRRSWFQDKPTLPHYDLRPSMRAKAIKAGAVPVSGPEMVRRCKRPMLGGNGVPPVPDCPICAERVAIGGVVELCTHYHVPLPPAVG